MKLSENMTAIDFMMKHGKAGHMMVTRATLDDKDETILLIREDTKYIKRLGHRPVFDLRGGVFELEKVIPVVVLVQINMDNDLLYETFYNYLWEDKEGEEIFNDLTKQDKLLIVFLNEKGEFARKIEIKNSLKELLTKGENIIKSKKWSMQEFDSAKEFVYSKYSSPQVLFNALNRY